MFSLKLRDIFDHKYSFLATAALLVIPVYSWKCFFTYWKKLKHEYQQEVIFNRRHNCVLTYQPNKGIFGWPPSMGRIKPNHDKLYENLYEPILYFIGTAEESLDISVMLINVKVIFSELTRAQRRGVRIRILSNFQHADSYRSDIKNLMAEGIQFQFFVAPHSMIDAIMHNKYMIKDYRDGSGFLFLGSMNLTASSPLNNYESLVFTSNHNAVTAFHYNFEECWEIVGIDNEGLISKTILIDAQLNT